MRLIARAPHSARQSPPRVGTDLAAQENDRRPQRGRLFRVRGVTWFVSDILPPERANRNGRWSVLTQVAQWDVWRLPLRALAWVLVTELSVLAWGMSAALADHVSMGALLRFGVLLACTLGHLIGTREPEERRRYADRRTEHVDLTSIWLFTAALALPVSLVLVLIVTVRAQRYLIARKAWHRFLFTSSAITASALGVHEVAALTSLGTWLSGTGPSPHHSVTTTAILAAALAAAVAVYFLLQALLVGGVRAMTTTNWSWSTLLGDRDTNLSILATLGLAVLAAVAQAYLLPLDLVIVPVVLRSTRVEQALRHATAERDHDALTGLPNRRGFYPEAAMHLIDDQMAERETALLFLDLDHFKQWNSRLGHIGADEVLKAVAKVLRTHTRQGDVLCRWGGEEMAAMLPATGPAQALEIAERIRISVSELRLTIRRPVGDKPIQLNHDGVPGCTISIGIATAPDHGTDIDALQETADQALYKAKDRGRNQVVLSCLHSERLHADQTRVADIQRVAGLR
jgi:diguanylate cyclase (GGDEF)-like protein